MTLRELKNVFAPHTKVCITAQAYTRETMCYHSFRTCVYEECFCDVNIDHLLDNEVLGVFCCNNVVCIDIIELVDEEVIMY